MQKNSRKISQFLRVALKNTLVLQNCFCVTNWKHAHHFLLNFALFFTTGLSIANFKFDQELSITFKYPSQIHFTLRSKVCYSNHFNFPNFRVFSNTELYPSHHFSTWSQSQSSFQSLIFRSWNLWLWIYDWLTKSLQN